MLKLSRLFLQKIEMFLIKCFAKFGNLLQNGYFCF